ncbi:MAG TPA: MASE1 domain-containing protein, partial [Rhodopila sp.]|nr:MASE1 domain-containing protein [Rhodopila sp.]
MLLLRRLNTRFVLHWPVMALVFGLAYFAAITLGQATSLRPSTIATFWPAAGLYVAALLLAAPRRWPALIAAAACTNLTCEVLMLGKPIAMVLGFAAANALEALTGAVLIRLLTRTERAAITPGARLRDTLAVAAGAAASPVVGATLGAAAVALATGAPFAATWPVWWAADALGILVAAPLALTAAHDLSARDHAAPIRRGEATLSFGVILAAALTIFWLPTHAATPALPPFLVLPPLVWTAVRLAPLPAMAAAALVAVVATAGTAAGFGVYAALGLSHAQLSVLLQMFLCVMVGTSQVLTAVITERRAALHRVAQANTGLEAAVTARAQALSDSEARLRVALLAAELGVWRWDVARGIDKLAWDARCKALHFLPADAPVTLEAWLETVVPEDRQVAQAGIDPALAPDNPNDDYACEYRVRCPDGTVRWLAATGRAFFRTDPASSARRRAIHVLGVTRDITHAREAEQERRRHEARQSYLLALNRSLHDLSDPRAMMQAASALLGQHLGAAQVGFAKIDDAQIHARVRQAWNDGRVASVAGTWRVHDIGAGLTEALRAGHTVAIPDIPREPRASDALETYRRIGVRALLGVPLIRDDCLVALLFVHHPEPRTWTADDVALAEETCQRLCA